MSHSARHPGMGHLEYLEHLRREAAAWDALGYPGVASYLRARAQRLEDPTKCRVCGPWQRSGN